MAVIERVVASSALLLLSLPLGAAPAFTGEPVLKPPPGIRMVREFRLEGALLKRVQQREPELEGITGIVLRRFGLAQAGPKSRRPLEEVQVHYSAQMERLGWHSLLTDTTGRRRGVAYASPDGAWLFAVNMDARGVVTSLVKGKISLEQIPQLERVLIRMLAGGPESLPAAGDLGALKNAEELVRSGRPAEAEQVLVKALSASPQSQMLRRRLAELYRSQGRRPEALAQMKAAVASDPASYSPRMEYASALYEGGDYQSALFEFSQAGALAPDKGAPRYFTGRCYQAMGKLAQAAEAYHLAARIAPHWSSVHIRLGEVYEAQGQQERAVESYSRALKADPASKQAADALARLRGGSGGER